MKPEDVDWLVYHRLPQDSGIAETELAACCNLDAPALTESLLRLERSCLIERNDGKVRMLTFGEALIKNQCRYEEDLPFTIENGVIKERRPK